jgi:methylthioribose-1-phosphate isomerase
LGLDRIKQKVQETAPKTAEELRYCVLSEAHKIAEEDIQANKKIGLNAFPLIPQNAKILHHCNTGGLATVDYGTALGIIRTAHELGKKSTFILMKHDHVFKVQNFQHGS